MGTFHNVTKLEKENNFTCKMCLGEWVRPVDTYRWDPLLGHLTDCKSLVICKKCARREIGTKQSKGWKIIQE